MAQIKHLPSKVRNMKITRKDKTKARLKCSKEKIIAPYVTSVAHDGIIWVTTALRSPSSPGLPSIGVRPSLWVGSIPCLQLSFEDGSQS